MLNNVQLEILADKIKEIDSTITFYINQDNEVEFRNLETNKRICVISPTYWGIIQFYDVKQCNSKEKELYKALEEFMLAIKINK